MKVTGTDESVGFRNEEILGQIYKGRTPTELKNSILFRKVKEDSEIF